ncbi:hypothetical protein [Erythrobacter sp. SG61-1L]|uniref:hypothetical protein n=1 Tax=Erythrobacter sp. SG61-1L TaxID=1603897 RepID=UPI000AEFD525|nr:hypothetical protein [Erythrobacter sp. SG61-1L]
MATLPSRDLKTGLIIDKTIDVLGRNVGPALAFVAVLVVLGTGVDYLAVQAQQNVSASAMLQAAALSLALVVVSIVGSYLLIEAMLKRTGLMSYQGERRFFAYLGMSLLIGLAVVCGLVFLIIPGLVFMARWSVAQALLIGRGTGAMDSMGKSWEATKGNEFAIILAALAMMVLFYALAFLPAILFPDLGMAAAVIGRVGSSAASVISTAMGVALYGLISARDVVGVFD